MKSACERCPIVLKLRLQVSLKNEESESESDSVVSSFCDPKDCIVHGILQARILEWGAFPFSRASSQLRDQTQVSCVAETKALQEKNDCICWVVLSSGSWSGYDGNT